MFDTRSIVPDAVTVAETLQHPKPVAAEIRAVAEEEIYAAMSNNDDIAMSDSENRSSDSGTSQLP